MMDWIRERRWLLRVLLLGDLGVMLALGLALFRLTRPADPLPAMPLRRFPGTFTSPEGAAHAESGNGAVVGQAALDFTLPTLDGGSVTLADLRGQPVVVNFWASWCQPCRQEMTELTRIYAAHKADGLVVLGVNLASQDTLSEVREFVQQVGVSFPVLLDESNTAESRYHLRGIPGSIFVDRSGLVRRVQIGVMGGQQVDAFVGEILSE